MKRILRMGVSLSVLAASSTLAMGMSSAAHAQNRDGAVIDLKTVTVTGESPTGPVTGYVAKQTTAGSKTGTAIEKIPQSITVIGREELESRQSQKIDSALAYTAGVTGAPYGYDSRTDWVFIRGFDATQTGIFMNGLPLYQYGFGGFLVDPYALERVEVLRGPSSVLYGGSNLGGLLNYVSKRPTDVTIRQVETGINTWGNAYGAFDLGGRANETSEWSYRITGKIAGGGSETNKASDFRGFIAPTLTYKPNAGTSLTLLGSYTNIDLTHPGGFLPYYGTVKPASFGRIKRDFYYNEPDLDLYKRSQSMIGYEFQHDLNNAWTFRQNVRYAYVDTRERGPYPYGYEDPSSLWASSNVPLMAGNLLHRLGFEHHTTVNTLSADNQLQGKFDTGPFSHTLLMGLDYKYYNINHMQASGSATPLSATNPVYGARQGALSPYLRQDYKMNQLGTYVQDQIRFADKWLLTLNGRYDRVWSESNDKVGNANFNGIEGAFSGRAGLSYEFSNGIVPYVSVARGFNPLIGSDFNGKQFKPETGVQYEAGVKYRPSFFDGLFTVAYYDITKQNVLTADTDHMFFSNQLGEVRSRGFEFEAQTNVTEGLKVIASVSVGQISIEKDTNATVIGKRPNVVPETSAALFADYTFQTGFLRNLGVQGGVRYIGASYADNQNLYKVPAVTMFDAGVHYKYNEWKFAVNVNNLLDKRYVASCSGALNCNYGSGRAASFKATYTW